MTALPEKYSNVSSGYHDPGGERMKKFLQCWKRQTKEWMKVNKKSEQVFRKSYFSVVNRNLSPAVLNFYDSAQEIDWFSIYDIEIGRRFLNASDVKHLKEVMPEDYFLMKEAFGDLVIVDEAYYVYNSASQNSEIRGSDIDDYLIFGSESGGVFYGEIHNEKSKDGEYQFIFYSPHGSVIRFKSFAHLLVNFYLEEYQLVNGLDPSMGHIYYFKGNWEETCVPLLFDAEEIASWK